MLNLGQVVGDYTIASGKLGTGNQFGDVYKAQKHDGTQSALKVCIRVDEKDRFIQENDILHELVAHDGIINPHTRIIEHASPKLSYYCMELADQNIAEYITQNPNLAFENTKNLYLQICKAIEYAHSKDVVHRDLHHGNVLVMLKDPVETKLTDFGKAKRFDIPLNHNYAPGSEWGRSDTVAPEVFFKIWSRADLTSYAKSSDIYSLGIILAFLFGIAADSYLFELFYGQTGIQYFFARNGIGLPSQLPLIKDGISLQDRRNYYKVWLSQYDYLTNQKLLLTTLNNSTRAQAVNNIIVKCCEADYTNRYGTVSDIIKDMEVIA